jgi:hypothetical protein
MSQKFGLDVRSGLVGLPEEASHIATKEPKWSEVFTPDDHQGALDPNRPIVIGDRGTGKSFWSSVLISKRIRDLVATRYPRLSLDKVEGRLGFSDADMRASHPGRNEISSLIEKGFEAEDLWRAVILRLSPYPPAGMPNSDNGWEDAVRWVTTDAAKRNSEFGILDRRLTQANQTYVLVLDALDVVSDRWEGIKTQLDGIIRLTLSVRALDRIRLKLFIRPDIADDRGLWEIGDASKLRHREVQLAWRRRDLYGLLWTLLANSQDQKAAKKFREHCATEFDLKFNFDDDSWRPPRQLVEDENRQQDVFRALAGDYMGAGPRRGDTYKWVTNHLADAAGFAAPRSFILAMKEAASKSKSQETVLDKTGIESGARDASRIRVQELSEDYRWMNTVFEVMAGLVVPMTEKELVARWRSRETIGALRKLADRASKDGRFIPPGDVLDTKDEADAYTKLLDQLLQLKILFRLSDERINMPDLFRLQANVKRKGGMKPRA